MTSTPTLIIGASLSGLASAVCLQRQGIDHQIIEREAQIAAPWRNHYDRLHLHTSKKFSHLPYKKFGSAIPRYPSRQQVIDYIEEYRAEFNINPLFNITALEICKQNDRWITTTTGGTFSSQFVIMATGPYGHPKPIQFPGLKTFPGQVLHSYDYRTGRAFKDQKVLVVGFGNSACEIAIDLYEQGAQPSMAVRSPVNVVPRDILGIPVLELSIFLSRLSPRIADRISRPLVRALMGDLTRLGLRTMPYGPLEQIHRDHKAPVLDIGTIRHIRQGHITLHDNIEQIKGSHIRFIDGKEGSFDAIIAAIGYDRKNTDIVDVDAARLEDLRHPVYRQQYFGKDGLYFCGYWISPTGQIREIASDAQYIARDISRRAAYTP